MAHYMPCIAISIYIIDTCISASKLYEKINGYVYATLLSFESSNFYNLIIWFARKLYWVLFIQTNTLHWKILN